jgi:hypothetical protein
MNQGRPLGPVIEVDKLISHRFCRERAQKLEQSVNIVAWIFLRGKDDTSVGFAAGEDLIVQTRIVAAVVCEDDIPPMRCENNLVVVVSSAPPRFLCGQCFPAA